MSIAGSPTRVRMTVEEFLALPEDGVHRELFEGEVRVLRQETWDDPDAPILPVAPKERPMTIRNRSHIRVETRFAQHLANWMDAQPEPRGVVGSGEGGFRLSGPDDSAVGIDVAVIPAELESRTPPNQKIYDGPPLLAVEILSPSDTHQDIVDMIALYLKHGVVTWIADPDLRSVAVHRAGHPSRTYYEDEELVGDPYLPGFRMAVRRFFT